MLSTLSRFSRRVQVNRTASLLGLHTLVPTLSLHRRTFKSVITAVDGWSVGERQPTALWRVNIDGLQGLVTANIRRAEAADVPGIEVIVKDAYSKYIERLGRTPAPMETDYYNLPDTQGIFVYEIERNVVGAIILVQAVDSLRVDNVVISPSVQGKGFGGVLMQFAEQMAVSKGHTAITLYTNEKMVENIALYVKMGFVETGRKTEDGYKRVYFRKRIL